MAAEVKAIDLLGSSPPIRALKISPQSPDLHHSANLDIPDEASKEDELGPYSSSSEKEGGSQRRDSHKRKTVTFAEYSNEPKGIMDSHDSDDEDGTDNTEPTSPFLALRSKRSASLPHIELNPKLNKKIKKMIEGTEEEDSLNTLLEGTLTLFEEKDKSTSELRYEYEFHGGQLLQVRIGDITEENVDAIVNEANSNLQHSSGIAGAIAQTGGRDIQIQSDRWIRKYGPVPPGRVAVTEAGALPAKRVIHAVGPIWRGGNSNEDHEYWDAVWHALDSANKHKFKTIAIPAIGIGFLGFPKERCAYLLVDCVSKFWMKYPKSKLREVRFVNYDAEVAEAIVFEMVGKFTSGCETSESEMDYSGSDLSENEEDLNEDVEEKEGEKEEKGEKSAEDEEEAAISAAGHTPEQKNSLANQMAQRKYVIMKAQSRRQSIA